MPEFIHLHNHTQFSLLDGATSIEAMMAKAKADGQKGVALTDHGNMFGAFKFVAEAEKHGIKPIVGCEFYLVEDRHRKSFSRSKGEQDVRYHQLLLAKNAQGYQNLIKLCSLGYIEGFYSKYPRIDKELVAQYHEGLIATSCCIGAEIPQTILKGDIEKAEKLLKWWIDLFGDDFYIELQRHRGLENIDGTGMSQEDVNQVLLGFAKKYGLKVIATNDSHYLDEDDAQPHDILLAINTGSHLEDTDRFRFPSTDFYFKTQEEMNRLFADVPQAVDYTMEIYDKVEKLSLKRDVLLPAFPVPPEFDSQDAYLRHLTMEGARRRYGAPLPPEVQERLEFELKVIIESGYSGYFLIVQDFTKVARELGVWVGPGRGSAAGSAVAYCLGITNVDPIEYDLLFERFLNPERVSMPDIDIDFDDEGREKVINYVVEKYGRNNVAQIITYGTMAAKLSLRDVGRVMNIPLNKVDEVTKTFPQALGVSLRDVLAEPDLPQKLKDKLQPDDLERAYKFRELAKSNDEVAEMIRNAARLEGSVRNTGIHACGIVITPDDITNYVPVAVSKDADLLVTQFDNSVAEDAGLLKMDFLGLKTLTIIKDACRIVEQVYGVRIDPDQIPLDDEKTYKLFQRGETIGLFQYESPGMQKYLRELKPTRFEDLIAMNALYRPGPMAYIPDFIDRKHGRQPITYDLPAMEEYLKETYGITVYQEQVMLLSQKLAGFSKGQADALRKAMGKKKKKILDEMYPLFIEGGVQRGHPKEVLEKIWKDWEAFASYAFNKSHSTCYALLAFQTGYLKAHYPAAFMASVLTHNKNSTDKLHFFLRECRRMGIEVLGPDINESQSDFTVNQKGQIRFGLSALKGVGEGPVEAILEEREKNGPFGSIYDLVRRLDLRRINRKVMEALALGGAFDCFEEIDRSQYFAPSDKYGSFIEHLLRYGQAVQAQKAQSAMSLFGGTDEVLVPEPPVPQTEPWPLIDKLEREKEVAGIYISGHPLDEYRMEVEHFTNCTLDQVLDQPPGRTLRVAGIVTKARHRISQRGTGYGNFAISDFNGTLEFSLFQDDYQKFKSWFEVGQCLFIEGAVELRYNSDEKQFRVRKVMLLESVSKQLGKGIAVRIDLGALDADLLDRLEHACRSNPGEHTLKLVVVDAEDKITLPFVAKAFKVHIGPQLTEALDQLNLQWKLN